MTLVEIKAVASDTYDRLSKGETKRTTEKSRNSAVKRAAKKFGLVGKDAEMLEFIVHSLAQNEAFRIV